MRRMCFIPFDYASNYRGQYEFSLPGYKIKLSYIWEKVLEVKISHEKKKRTCLSLKLFPLGYLK